MLFRLPLLSRTGGTAEIGELGDIAPLFITRSAKRTLSGTGDSTSDKEALSVNFFLSALQIFSSLLATEELSETKELFPSS